MNNTPQIINFDALKATSLWQCPPIIANPHKRLSINYLKTNWVKIFAALVAIILAALFVFYPNTFLATAFGFFALIAYYSDKHIIQDSSASYRNLAYILTPKKTLYIFEEIDKKMELSEIISIDKITAAQHKEYESLIYTDSLTPIVVPHYEGKSLAKLLLQLHPDNIIDPDK